MRSIQIFALFAFFTSVAAFGCTWETDLPDDVKHIEVVADRELLVTDRRILDSSIVRNSTNGALGFRHAVEHFPLDDGALDRWLARWTGLPPAVRCRWLRAEPANRCDATCTACEKTTLRPDVSPFRLAAVVNRTDLSVMPDRLADGGEGRLVFAVTDGPADDPSSPVLASSVIFEYAQIGTARTWAQAWHSLGQVPDEEYPAALVRVTGEFVDKGSLAQIRTADASNGGATFQQFRIEDGEIRPALLRNTPEWDRMDKASVVDFIDRNTTAIDDGTAVLPIEWLAPSSSVRTTPPAFVTALPRGPALVKQTCGGCHAQSPSGFHLNSTKDGLLRSAFMNSEIERRSTWLKLTLWREGMAAP